MSTTTVTALPLARLLHPGSRSADSPRWSSSAPPPAHRPRSPAGCSPRRARCRPVERARDRHTAAWSAATAVGLAVGLTLGSSLVGFETTLGCPRGAGVVSGACRRRRPGPSCGAGWDGWRAWPAYLAGAWALGWTVTDHRRRVDEQFTVFGSAGALTAPPSPACAGPPRPPGPAARPARGLTSTTTPHPEGTRREHHGPHHRHHRPRPRHPARPARRPPPRPLTLASLLAIAGFTVLGSVGEPQILDETDRRRARPLPSTSRRSPRGSRCSPSGPALLAPAGIWLPAGSPAGASAAGSPGLRIAAAVVQVVGLQRWSRWCPASPDALDPAQRGDDPGPLRALPHRAPPVVGETLETAFTAAFTVLVVVALRRPCCRLARHRLRRET